MSEPEIPLTPAGHQAAHILLDAISAWDPAKPNDFTAPDREVGRLLEVGAVYAEHDEATGRTDMYVSGLLQGATTTMVMMIAAIAAQNDVSMPTVIEGLRKQIDLLPRE